MLFTASDTSRATSPGWARSGADFEGHVRDALETVEYDFNWKTFIEVYLEGTIKPWGLFTRAWSL